MKLNNNKKEKYYGLMSIKKNTVVDDFDKCAQIYYNEISNYQPLKRSEENKLWKRYKYNHDLCARNKLIESNLKFVAKIAKLYKGRGLSYGELVAEGNLGLLKAIDKFEGNKGFKMTSYSVWWIRQTILEALEKRNVTDSEDYPKDYEEPLDDENNNEKAVVQPKEFLEEEKQDNNNYEAISILLNSLTDREKEIISRYYGVNGEKPETLEEIGEDMGLTKERIRQISEKALKKMRSQALNKSILDTIYN